MAKRQHRPKRSMESAVEMAIAAVEGSPHANPLDMGLKGIDPSPTSLDLPARQEAKACPHRRYVCADCGSPLRRSIA